MDDVPIDSTKEDAPAIAVAVEVDDAEPCEMLHEPCTKGNGTAPGGLLGNKSRRKAAAPDCVEIADLERSKSASNEVVDINSDSTSSSSDTDSSGRSRSRQRSKRVGAAAATALLTAAEPLDVDVGERLVEKELQLPTSFAARLQHEGGTVAIMVETGAQISILPREGDPNESIVRLIGTEHAVGRAVASLELGYSTHKAAEAAAPAPQVLAQVEIPARFLNAVVGPNAETISEVRAACKGIMIALQPPERPGGPMVAFIGPSDGELVAHAERQIRERLLLAEAAAEAAAEPVEPAGAADGAAEAEGRSNPHAIETAAAAPIPAAPHGCASTTSEALAGEAGNTEEATDAGQVVGTADLGNASHLASVEGGAAGPVNEKGSDSDGLEDIP